jgi:hypothetical protein
MAVINEHDPDKEQRAVEREQVALRHVKESLAEDYGDDHPREEVEAVVEEVKENYDDAAVREFVPIMVERDARETLRKPE